MIQLVRSTPITKWTELRKQLQELMDTPSMLPGSRLYWDNALPRCIKFVMDPKNKLQPLWLAELFRRYMSDGEWALFVETLDSDVFGDPVMLFAVTDQSVAEVNSMDLVRMIMSPVVDVEESSRDPLDIGLIEARVGDAESGSTGGS